MCAYPPLHVLGRSFSPKRNEGIPLVTSLGGLNFYHWVALCLTRKGTYAETGGDKQLCVDPVLPSFVFDQDHGRY